MSQRPRDPATNPPSGASESLVRLSRTDFVSEIGLYHPPLNLVTRELLEALHAVLLEVSQDPSIRCLVIHQGPARAFCAGSDMREFEAVRDRAVDRKILYEEYVIRLLAQLSCPTIAAIDGPALGGGLELALACDLRIACAEASLGLTESRIGGLGGTGAVRLTRLVGPARAAEMLFMGKVVDADQAYAWGLVNEVATGQSALQRARDWACEIATRGPLSNAFAKRLIAASLDQTSATALSLANELQDQIFRSNDLHKGAAAFFSKNPVEFEGR